MPVTSNLLTNNNLQKTARTGYKRLKRIFTSNFNYTKYNNIVGNTQNKVLGNLPSEILNAALRTKDKEYTIKTIHKGFAQAAQELLMLQTLRAEAVKKYTPNKETIKRAYTFILDGDYEEYEHLKKLLEKSILPEEICAVYEMKASNLLKKAMSEILPEGANIKFKKLGLGNFAEAYKIEFRDNKNQKIFSDYTIKLYRDAKEKVEINKELDNRIKEVLHNLKDDEIKELYKKWPIYTKCTPDLWKEVIEQFRKDHIPLDQKTLQEIKKQALRARSSYQSNGVNAEANIYFYISNACGHSLTNTNLNKHYMFDLENRFNISAFSDGSLPEVRKYVNYSKIGVIPFDSYDNYSNMVYGRVIDVGGMAKINEELTDKTVRKFFKKIMNRNSEKEKQHVIEQLKLLVSNPKTPNRQKIKKAIELAENIKTGYEG